MKFTKVIKAEENQNFDNVISKIIEIQSHLEGLKKSLELANDYPTTESTVKYSLDKLNQADSLLDDIWHLMEYGE